MKKLTLIWISFCLAMAGPALGQLDQDPDGIGLYADLGGMNNHLLTDETVVEVHLLATNMTGTEIKVWAARVRVDGNAVVTGISIPYENRYWMLTPAADIYEYGVEAFPDEPRDYTEITQDTIIHLASLQLWLSDTEPVDLYLELVRSDPEYHLPFYYWEELGVDGFRYLYPSSGSVDLPVMRINGAAPVPVEPKSWSDLKAVFR